MNALDDNSQERQRRRVSRAARAIGRGSLRTTALMLRAAGWSVLTVALVLSVLFGYGISSHDLSSLQTFNEAVDSWKAHADFREVGREYVHESYLCMNTSVANITATQTMMALRSLPGLPSKLAVNSTSQKHYDDFTRGELSAYLHLCGEQGTNQILPMLNDLARQQPLTDQKIEQFLETFKLSAPIAHDQESVQSVRQLLADTHATEDFTNIQPTEQTVMVAVQSLAEAHGWQQDPADMTPEQQATIYTELDAYVRTLDYQGWRTKQVTDFLNGIWGQCYSQLYKQYAIQWILSAHAVGRWSTWFLLMGAGLWLRSSFRKDDKPFPNSQGIRVEPA